MVVCPQWTAAKPSSDAGWLVHPEQVAEGDSDSGNAEILLDDNAGRLVGGGLEACTSPSG